jgi:leucyl-tRNA synthetase
LTSPFAPFITQELWERLGEQGWITNAQWPQYDQNLMQEKIVTWVVQVNGKVRDRLELAMDTPQEEVEQTILSRARIKEWTAEKNVFKIIFVPNKLANIVVEE